MPSRLLTPARLWFRRLLYSPAALPIVTGLHGLRNSMSEHETADYWNSELSGRMSAPNINGRLSNAVRDTTSTLLIRHCGSTPRRVLDVGCGFADLARMLIGEGTRLYVGVDLSDYVVERNIRECNRWSSDPPCEFAFHASDLRDYTPEAEISFDVIVFNEVLKYLDVNEAIQQLQRYSRWLEPDGVMCVNLTDDPKCRLICKQAARNLQWIYGVVYQQRPDGPHYRLTTNRAVPAYLTGLFRPRPAAALAA